MAFLGNLVDKVGTKLGLPEYGISERLSPTGRTSNTGITQQSQRSGYTPYNPVPSSITNTRRTTPPTSSPQVLGLQNLAANSGSGGGGSGYSIPQNQSYDQGAPYESIPGQPDFESEYGNLFNEALAALDQSAGAYQQSTAADIEGIDQSAARQKGIVEAQKTEGLNELTKQATREQTSTEKAQNQIRQRYAEIAQGIQGLYGSTTGTGAFANELQGRETQRIMSENEANLSATLRDIDTTRTNVISRAFDTLREIDTESENLKRKANAELQQALAQINAQKGGYLAERQAQRLGAVKEWQGLVASINARNAAFKQDLFTKQKDFEQQIQSRKLNAVSDHQANLIKDIKTLLTSGVLSDSGLRQAEQAYGVPVGTFQQKKEDDLLGSGGGSLTEEQKKAAASLLDNL